MELKKLEVPTSSITEVKKSPMTVFEQARQAGTGVYIFNREKIAGVMLTKEQYEGLLEELTELRQRAAELVSEPAVAVKEIETVPAGLEELAQSLRQKIVPGTVVSARYLDEQMVFAGFITKKTGFGGVTEMLRELENSGKIVYQLRRKENGQQVYGEIEGTLPENQPDHLKIEQFKLIAR
ncbi:type II toxin-antitoxin system Phd/YefM family antitoxin [Enterococcus sp. CSURQ0835]|uniref:type II toxin-antitoxin system Phd/YefM family antitoxin n=1 Tax=Enterococcus sp. CSURQ0835 TaxID=2681394 RepID=UPI00135CB0E3|nr:type II toxin-antitoxin system Phd/YefM family antitoxin [Enterococcus sp. CSURQ0835]